MKRERFLKITGLFGAGLLSGVPGFAGIFDEIPPEEQDFLQLCGIRPDPASIGEKGVHLRWVLPPSKGFPELISIYRRATPKKSTSNLLRPSDSRSINLPGEINGLRFSGYSPSTRFKLGADTYGAGYLNTQVSAGVKIRITFPLPVDYCKINLGGVQPLNALSFAADNTQLSAATIPDIREIYDLVFQSNGRRKIAYVEIPLNFKMLHFIEYASDQLLCDMKDWVKIGELNNKRDFTNEELVWKRINQDAINYFLPPGMPARGSRFDHYKKQALYFYGLYDALKNPTPATFIIQPPFTQLSEVPVDKLLLRSTDNKPTLLRAWKLLEFAAVDPNIARMLGFYFVDRKPAEDEADSTDYKVEAYYEKGKQTICGVLQKVSKQYSHKPQLEENLSATQVDTSWWEFEDDISVKKHYGKVRLSWPSPLAPGMDNLRGRFTSPVVYSLGKNNLPVKLIGPRLEVDNDRLFFTDREVMPGNTQCKITGIDIFGQQSNMLSASCQVKDKDIPPAPVKLSFKEEGSTIKLGFEYGGSQYMAGPDAKEFKIYQRNNFVFDSKRVRFTSLAADTRNESGFKVFRVSLQDAGDISGFRYISFLENNSGKKLPAAGRKKFRIKNVSGNTIFFTCTIDYQPPASGWLRLSKDAGERSVEWQFIKTIASADPRISPLNDYTHFINNTQDPDHFSGQSVSASNSFTCKAIHTIRQATIKDPFEKAEEFHQQAFTEILLDRQLSLAEIFTGGKVQVGNSVHAILFQSAGIATPPGIQTGLVGQPSDKNKYARLIVEGHLTIPANTTLRLLPPVHAVTGTSTNNKLNGYLILRLPGNTGIESASGGEVLLLAEWSNTGNTTDGKELLRVTGRVCSDFYRTGSRTEVMVFIDKRIHSLYTNKPLAYFAPYEADITSRVAALAPGIDEAHRSAYFSIETVDKASPANVSPLSSVAQFIKVRNKNEKPAKPLPPYPCGNSGAVAGYLKPPNKEGNSAFCLQWMGSTNGLRYEVGRTLDKTIIAVHKDLWLKGMLNADAPLLPAQSSTNGNSSLQVGATDIVTGLVEVSASFNLGTLLPEIFSGGRLIQGTGSNVKGFEIIHISHSGLNLKMILRPMTKGVLPDASTFKIEQLPDYSFVLMDDEQIRQLANKTHSAFSIVTGMPLRNTNQFLDNVPGKGSSRFFYKVRAVDASENRSDWSDAGVAIHQVDTTPPDLIQDFNVELSDRSARLLWPKNSLSPNIDAIEILRSEEDPAVNPIPNYAPPTHTIQKEQLTYKSIIAKSKLILLPSPFIIPVPAGNADLSTRVNRTLQDLPIVISRAEQTTNLFDPAKFELIYEITQHDTHLKLNGIKVKEDGIVPEYTPLKIQLGSTIMEKDANWFEYSDEGLTGGQVLHYGLRAVKRIKYSQDANQGEILLKGKPTSFKRITVIDRTTPPPPVIQLQWVDESGNETTNLSLIKKIKISFSNAQGTWGKIIVQKREAETDNWKNVVINGEAGWVNFIPSVPLCYDLAVEVQKSYQYRAAYQTKDNRNSEFSNPISIQNLG